MAHDVSKQAGEFATNRARREWVRSGLLMLVMLVGIAAALLALQIDHSAAYVLPLVALALLAGLLGRRRSSTALPWSLGAESERAVGEVLDELRAEGFIVVHDVEQPREGNVDHLVSGPTGVFMIETKRSRYNARDLTKARRQAARLHDVLGAWVTPVICLDRRHQRPIRHDRVWIVGCPFLCGWIRAQAGQLADVERVARFPDQL
jgi:hypothetical protein